MIIFLICFFSSIICGPGATIVGHPEEGCYPPSHATLGSALDDVEDWDILLVCPGHHSIAHDLHVSHSITIRGVGDPPSIPTIDFTHECANMDLEADDIHIQGLRFTNSGGPPTGCALSSDYAISSPTMACHHRIHNLKVEDCIFEGGMSGILLRTSGDVRIRRNHFDLLEGHAIHVARSGCTDAHVKISENTFTRLGGNGIHVEPILHCTECDRVQGQLKVEHNLAYYRLQHFFYFRHWNYDCLDCDLDLLKIRHNRIGDLEGTAILFDDPQEGWCAFDAIHIEHNVMNNTMGGIVVRFAGDGSGVVPPDDFLHCKRNEFCRLRSVPGMIYIGHEDYDIGYTEPAPSGMTLAPFVDHDNRACHCFDIPYDEGGGEGVCSGRGDCWGGDLCTDCEDPYYGEECECHGHGACHSCPHRCWGLCPYEEGVCHDHGECTGHNTCDCDSDWDGDSCDTECAHHCQGICSESTEGCDEHGTCVGDDTCDCDPGWMGMYCNETDPECPFHCYGTCPGEEESVCHGHGECVDDHTCICEEGWEGAQCQSETCDYECFGQCHYHPDICSGHGACVAEDTCECRDNWGGEYCNRDDNTCGHHCYGHGHCIDDMCHCTDDWDGFLCGFYCPAYFDDRCHGIRACDEERVCHGHGTCMPRGMCFCDHDYWGDACQYTGEPYLCYGLHKWMDGACSDHGQCVANDTCVCHRGWHGDECESAQDPVECDGYPSTHDDVCSGHGVCIDDEICACESGWGSQYCQDPAGMTCCTHPPSDDGACYGHGKCVGQNECRCYTGWWGDLCESDVPVITCHGVSWNSLHVCHGHGDCIGENNCECHTRWHGRECEETGANFLCFRRHAWSRKTEYPVCSGNGVCLAPNTCRCYPGFHQFDCSESKSPFDCYGKPPYHEMVCSAQGICVDDDHCRCDPEYWGNECQNYREEPTCFGIRADQDNVCHGHGECIRPDHCECDPLYDTTEDCEDPVECWSIPAVPPPTEPCPPHPPHTPCHPPPPPPQCRPCVPCHPKPDHPCRPCRKPRIDCPPCSGHGDCVGFNNCTCDLGWEGDLCNEPNFTCYEYAATDPEACMEHGDCVAEDTCECDPGWIGRNCEIHIEIDECEHDKVELRICHGWAQLHLLSEHPEVEVGWILEEGESDEEGRCLELVFEYEGVEESHSGIPELELLFGVVHDETVVYEFSWSFSVAYCRLLDPYLGHVTLAIVLLSILFGFGLFLLFVVVGLLCYYSDTRIMKKIQ